MPGKIVNHGFECYIFAGARNPLMVELAYNHTANNMREVKEGVFPELHHIFPVFILVILYGNPSVVVPEGGVVWKDKGRALILQMNYPVDIVRS